MGIESIQKLISQGVSVSRGLPSLSGNGSALSVADNSILSGTDSSFSEILKSVGTPPLQTPSETTAAGMQSVPSESSLQKAWVIEPWLTDQVMKTNTTLVEVPGSFQETGNADADALISQVLLQRRLAGIPSDISTRDVASAQASLISLGYGVGAFGPYANGVDGVLGEVTSASLLRFQQDSGLKVTGTLTQETAEVLKLKGKDALDAIQSAWETSLAASPFFGKAYAGTANPFWYIQFVQGPGDNPETMANIDPVFKGRLAALARDAGKCAYFGEGYRDFDRQATLYQKYLDGSGALAAKPGTSKHNMGLAVDTASDWLQGLEDGLSVERQVRLAEYGLFKPMAGLSGIQHENWHLQPVETMLKR